VFLAPKKMVRKTYGLICLLFVMVSFVANAQVVVSTGGPPTNYATLTAAFTAINNGTHTGAITITLTASHTLTAAAILNASGTGSANYSSINISPNTNVTISSSLSNVQAIRLSGADNVTIDGLNSSGRSLSITNSGTGSSSTIYFLNGASNNTINRCTILSGSSAYGTIIFDWNSDDNNNNTISNCNIGPTGSFCRSGIFAWGSGTLTYDHSWGTNILNNNIYDFHNPGATAYGIYQLSGHRNWTISGNKFYQTTSKTINVADADHYVVYVNDFEGRTTISNNTIGYSNSSNSGTYTISSARISSFYGIYAVGNTTDTLNIQGNAIKNIVFSTQSNGTTFRGIFCTYGLIKIGNQTGNVIGDATSTGNITVNMNALSGSSAYSPIYGIQITGASTACTIKNNFISGINYNASTSSFPLGMFGIYVSSGVDSINNNTVGSNVTANSIRLGSSVSTANQLFYGIYFSSTSSSTYIQNNVIRNILLNGAGTNSTYSLFNGIHCIGSPCLINNNTIRTISHNSGNTSSTASASITGIYVNFTSGSGSTINDNLIQELRNLNTTSAVTVSGIYHANGTTTNIERNKIIDLGVNGTASGTIANGIFLVGGTANARNNFVHFNNSLTQSPRGINISGGTGHTCHFNTVLIEGTNTLTGASACFYRGDNFVMNVQNNIFFNRRSSSGNNYSIFNNNGAFSNATINYNLHVVPNINTTVYYAGAARTWTNYYTVQNTSDRFSWCESTTNLSASSLFNNTTTSDLTINSGNSACWYVNGKGWPISGIQYDWEGDIGDERSQAVNGGGTDIGADEFTTSTTPPGAIASAAPAAGTTTTYTFAGKTIATIAWTGGSNVPASVSVWYYSGNNPPVPIPGKNAFNCYWRIEPSTTPSGMSYRPTLYFSDALLGAVPSTTDLRMAKNSGLTPNINNWSCACSGTTVNATTRTFVPTTPYTSFSIFTGTDINAPLPVELLSFTATKQDKDILLQWQTASEKNTERFDIERSYNGKDFEYTGKTVSAADMSNTLRSYNAIDEEYARTAAIVYYRLKIVDYDGFFEYSNIAVVTNNTVKQTSAVIHPNPFGNSTKLTLQNATSGSIEITIIDLAGNQLYAQIHDLKNPEEEIKIDTEFLKSGTYVLRIVSAQESITTKLIRY
jgi:hypothetical protein